MQSGREVRIMVVPDKIDDASALKLARDIKDRIEAEMTYPGQIKVSVIREYRAIETAK
jgi:ribonuclease Y